MTNRKKSILSKIVLSTMILTLLYASLGMTTASAATAALNSTVENNQSIENNEKLADENIDGKVEVQASSAGNKYWDWVRNVLLIFVGVTVANAFITNAVNNGIDAACNNWDDNWGVRQACKVFQS